MRHRDSISLRHGFDWTTTQAQRARVNPKAPERRLKTKTKRGKKKKINKKQSLSLIEWIWTGTEGHFALLKLPVERKKRQR